MIKDKPLSKKQFQEIYSTVPRLCVDVLIHQKNGVLLTFRKIKPSGIWHIPGGTVLMNESLTESVKRVANNELGVEVEVVKLLGVIDFFPYSGLGHPITLVHLVKVIRGQITLDDQASEYRYFQEPPVNMIQEHRQFLINYLKGKKQ